jgi:hypothetical protein
MTSFNKCGNCGAPVELSADGRSIRCDFCGAGQTRAVDPGLLAASLRAEGGSTEHLFDALATKLATQLPDLARVERSGGFFSAKRIEVVEVAMGDLLFALRREGTRVVATRGETVRGIVVKTEPMAVDAWVEALCAALSAHATSSARTLEALKKISG